VRKVKDARKRIVAEDAMSCVRRFFLFRHQRAELRLLKESRKAKAQNILETNKYTSMIDSTKAFLTVLNGH
jgi:hypothetical protein